MEQAARRVPISGLVKGMYCDEGEGTKGAYLLFFKPNAMPLFTATVLFRGDVAVMPSQEIADRAEVIIRQMMASSRGQ